MNSMFLFAALIKRQIRGPSGGSKKNLAPAAGKMTFFKLRLRIVFVFLNNGNTMVRSPLFMGCISSVYKKSMRKPLSGLLTFNKQYN